MEILKAILFGIVEGITEWLPISSTGHMILLNDFIHLNVTSEFYKLFEVVIQLGAILAVVLIYFKKIWPFNKPKEEMKNTFSLWGKILVACVPAAIIGLLFDDWFNEHFYNSIVVSIALILYGIIFIIFERCNVGSKKTNSLNSITYKQAFVVGIFQVLALIPGTSRSGATIVGGLLIGLERKTIADFTFLLAIPVMAGASLLKLVKYIKNVGFVFASGELLILGVGSLVAFIVSIIVIKFLLSYIKKHNFEVFGWYRIALGIIVLLYFLVIK